MLLPAYQAVEFLEWLSRRAITINKKHFDRQWFYRLAIEYIRSGMELHKSQTDLEIILHIFTSCPMITEDCILKQIDHFCFCGGHCIEYIKQKEGEFFVQSLHPLLRQFLSHSEKTGFRHWVANRNQREFGWGDTTAIKRMNEKEWFTLVMSRIGLRLREEFREFLSKIPFSLGLDFELNRHSGRVIRLSIHPCDRNKTMMDEEGTHLIRIHENPEKAADRLVSSIRELIHGKYYDRMLVTDPQVMGSAALSPYLPEYLLQSIDFLSWIHQEYPNLNINGDIPSEQLIDLVHSFCEPKGYNNVASFTITVKNWIKGEGSPRLLELLSKFIWCNAPGWISPYSYSSSLFKRHQRVQMHAMFHFLPSGNFHSFIDKYWKELNVITGDYVDVYYGEEDLKERVSGYKTLTNLNCLNVGISQLPAIVLWQRCFEDARTILLGNLKHDDILKIMKVIVQKIKEGSTLNQIQELAMKYVDSRLKLPK